MSGDFVASLKEEIARLEDELARDVRAIRLRELRRVLGLYQVPTDRPIATEGLASLFVPPPEETGESQRLGLGDLLSAGGWRPGRDGESGPAIARRGGRQASPEREKALQAARLLISNRAGPVPTREVLEHLESIGIQVGGENPLNNLSAMLSNSEQFTSHGRSGWTLRSEDPELVPIEASFYDQVAEEVLSDFEIDVIRSLGDSHAREIPSDIDGRLLAIARDRVGRQLSTDERKLLREAFRRNVPRAIG